MSDEQQPLKVAAQLVVTLYEGGAINVSFPPDEAMCRYLCDKARATLDDHWRQLNAPKIVAPSGPPVNGLPEALRRAMGR